MQDCELGAQLVGRDPTKSFRSTRQAHQSYKQSPLPGKHNLRNLPFLEVRKAEQDPSANTLAPKRGCRPISIESSGPLEEWMRRSLALWHAKDVQLMLDAGIGSGPQNNTRRKPRLPRIESFRRSHPLIEQVLARRRLSSGSVSSSAHEHETPRGSERNRTWSPKELDKFRRVVRIGSDKRIYARRGFLALEFDLACGRHIRS